MLDHADPAVVGVFRVRELAARIGGDFVELGKFDLLELVGLVIEHRPGIRGRCHRALHHRRLGVARELKIGVGRDRCGAGVGYVVRDVDDIAAAMKGQLLLDLDAVGGRCLQLEHELVHAGSQLARPGQRLPKRSMVRKSLAQQSCLRDKCPLGVFLQQYIRLALVVRITVRREIDLGQDRAEGIDRGRVQIGLDDDFLARRARGGDDPRHRAGQRRRNSAGYWRRDSASRNGRIQTGRWRSLLRCRRRDRRPMLGLPALPEEQRRKRKNDEQDQTLGIHEPVRK